MSDHEGEDWVLATTAATFEEDVLGKSVERPVVVDFWAPWCAPCRALAPVLEKLAVEYQGRFLLVKANTDELPEAAARFNVQGIPAVFAVINGELVDMFTGSLPETTLRQWLDRVLAVGAFREAERIEGLSPAGAEVKYRAILETDPKHDQAKIGLCRTLVAQERFAEAAQILGELERRGFLEPEAQRIKATLDLQGKQGADLQALRAAAESNPRDLAASFALAEALAGEKQFEESLQLLLSLVQRDRKGTGERARQLMIEIFQALPGDSELTTRFRRQLSMALY